MIIKAYSKINYSLDIVGKREDNYHLLEMVMQTVDLFDTVDVSLCRSGINLFCDKKYIPCNEKNIAYKAAKAFIEETGYTGGVSIKIKKKIPVGAGMAGGSADGAAVIKGLNTLTGANLSREKMLKIGAGTGADIPFCLTGGTALVKGIGEVVIPIENRIDPVIAVAKPVFGINTASAFKKVKIERIRTHPDTKGIIKAIENANCRDAAKKMKNVLENVLSGREKRDIFEIKRSFTENGSWGAVMTGSGSTVFGIFENEKTAKKAIERVDVKLSFSGIFKTV